MRKLSALFLLAAALAAAPLDWHPAKLLHIDRDVARFDVPGAAYPHTDQNGNTTYATVPTYTARRAVWYYTIETEHYVYLLEWSGRWHHPPSLTENAEVRLAVDAKRNFHILDENGKDFRLGYIKRRLK